MLTLYTEVRTIEQYFSIEDKKLYPSICVCVCARMCACEGVGSWKKKESFRSKRFKVVPFGVGFSQKLKSNEGGKTKFLNKFSLPTN